MILPVPGSLGCAACPAAQGRSCCEVRGEERLATLTAGDIARIREATNLAEAAFVDREPYSPEEQLAYEALRPANRGAVRGGVRRHLLARGGACVFHRAGQGCSLPRPARPLLCRLYPFERNALDRWVAHPVGRCHAADSSQSEAALLRALGTSRRQLERLHARLLAELREPEPT